MKSIRRAAHDFVETTSLQPIAEVKTAPFFLFKIGWIIAFIIASYFLIDHVYGLTLEYRKYGVNINIKDTPEESLAFPSITVCNLNSLKKDNLECSPFRGLATLNGESSSASSDESSSGSSSGSGQISTQLTKCANDIGVGGVLGSGEEKLSGSNDESSSWTDTSGANGDTSSGGSSGESGSVDSGAFSDGTSSQWGSGMNQVGGSPEFKILGNIRDQLKNATVDTLFHILLNSSETGDLSDVRGIVTFSPNDTKQYGYTKEEMIVQCSIDRSRCNHSDFSTFYSTYYGNCYTFNSGIKKSRSDLWITNRYGSRNGLRLILNLNSSQYIGYLTSEYGARVTINSPLTVPRPEDTGINVGPGTKVTIGVKRRLILRKSHPYESNCTDHIPLKLPFDQPAFPDNAEYTIDDCQRACYQVHLYKCCDCVLPVSAFDDANATSSTTYREYAIGYEDDLFCKYDLDRKLVSNDAEDRITCNCPPPCKSYDYNRIVYTTGFPSDQYLTTALTHFDEDTYLPGVVSDMFLKAKANTDGFKIAKEFIRNNVVFVQVYYETLTTTIWTEEAAYSFQAVFGDIGGTMGIYMGLSIMTLLEMLQFFVTKCCFCCCCRRRKPKNEDTMETPRRKSPTME